LSPSLLGVSWLQPFTVKDVLSGLEKEDEKVLGFWCLEDDSFSYLVDCLEGKEQKDFEL